MPDPAASLYDQDFYAWVNEQAALLRAEKLSVADIAHIAEEIKSIGRTEQRELENRLAVLLLHLLNLPEAIFPTPCLWAFQDIMDAQFWPGEARPSDAPPPCPSSMEAASPCRLQTCLNNRLQEAGRHQRRLGPFL